MIQGNQGPIEFDFQKDPLVLTAYNENNKYNGFYRVVEGKPGPVELTMGPWTLSHHGEWLVPVDNPNDFGPDLLPVKAKDSSIWIVMRQTTTEAPNLYITDDLRTFRPLTTFRPQMDYNWVTAELVSWKQFDGTSTQGVLYRPENFDPHKKYPVIINYYEQLSQRLYEFPRPDYMKTANPDIAWFVSNGYLILTPDIKYPKSQPGYNGLYNAVVSAASWLSRLPFVEPQKMAIAGHSFGGAETNYLITHTHLFAAVIQGSGATSDLVSRAFLPYHDGHYQLSDVESGMGATLWQRPDWWTEISPVYHVDNVSSPFLILHCKSDDGWLQSVELFTALRRLGKEVWMLQYDNGRHLVFGNDAIDFTLRATQFLDHFLKGKPAPVWMTRGVPAKLKGIDSGLEIDNSFK